MAGKHQAEGRKVSKSAFVVMPFDRAFDPLHRRAIRPALEALGLNPERYDDAPRTDSVIEEMRRSIDRARVVIAVVTGKNPHVFFELGLTLARRKPCVLLSAAAADVPDFLRDLPHVVYGDDVTTAAEGLARQLRTLLARKEAALAITRR